MTSQSIATYNQPIIEMGTDEHLVYRIKLKDKMFLEDSMTIAHS